MRNRLKELRARDGLNQTQLAKLAGVSRQTISLIERNNFMPSVLTAIKIARIFNETVETVLLLRRMKHENTKIYRISLLGGIVGGIIGGILGNFDGLGIENLTFATYNNVVVISIVATMIIILVEAIVLMNQRRALKYKRLVDEEVDIDATDQYELLANRYVLNGSILSVIQTIIAFVVLLIFVVGQAEANAMLFF